MKQVKTLSSIEIDNEVLGALARRATGFNVTPNDVIRGLLDLEPLTSPNSFISAKRSSVPPTSRFRQFLESEGFKRNYQAVNRFLAILGWLHSSHPTEFANVVKGYSRGRRVYFANNREDILRSSRNVQVRAIPESTFWVLTTLDNRSKRMIVEEILRSLKYLREDVEMGVAVLADSGIRRRSNREKTLADYA